jgi:hypothetical protein
MPDPRDFFEDDDVCVECDGEGYVLNDCFEDTCCCEDPEMEHGYGTCPSCGGRG